ncbi:MAG: class I SAM-dependent methyltransferase [Spirochaetia bacterium]
MQSQNPEQSSSPREGPNETPREGLREKEQGDIFASAESKRSYNRTLFSTVAPQYTTATRVLSFGRDQAWKRDLLQECEKRLADTHAGSSNEAGITSGSGGAGMRILDLACGTGDLTLALAERFPHAEILGVDLNPDMLAEAKRRLKTSSEISTADRTASVRFIEADMSSLPFAENEFTLVTAGYALRNAPNLSQTLAEVRRVLAPGGLLAVLEFSRSPVRVVSSVSIALLHMWGSLWGLILHRDAAVYGYIARSLAHYPDRTRFNELLEKEGFSAPERQLRMFGLLELCFAYRPAV